MNNRFKTCLMEFDEITQKRESEKRTFICDVRTFMESRGIPVKVLFFGDTFAIDIHITQENVEDAPITIPLGVLMDFCNEFGCDFRYTRCDGNRWIFSFDGLDMGVL